MTTTAGFSYVISMDLFECLACGCRWDAWRSDAPECCQTCPPPLAGHKGDCAKVQTAQFQGVLNGRCSCGVEQ